MRNFFHLPSRLLSLAISILALATTTIQARAGLVIVIHLMPSLTLEVFECCTGCAVSVLYVLHTPFYLLIWISRG